MKFSGIFLGFFCVRRNCERCLCLFDGKEMSGVWIFADFAWNSAVFGGKSGKSDISKGLSENFIGTKNERQKILYKMLHIVFF